MAVSKSKQKVIEEPPKQTFQIPMDNDEDTDNK